MKLRKGQLKKIVDEVLANHPITRENDTFLVIYVWRKLSKGKFPYVPYNVIINLPSPESITRIRREIQNDEGRHLPPPDVVERRRILEEEYRYEYARKEY